MSLKASNILVEDRVYYTYRGKGGKTGKRELPPPAAEAINTWLAATGRSVVTMVPDDSPLARSEIGSWDHQRDLLHKLASLPEGRGLAFRRRPHLPAQRREAQTRCR